MLNVITTNIFLWYSVIILISVNSLRILKEFCFTTNVQWFFKRFSSWILFFTIIPSSWNLGWRNWAYTRRRNPKPFSHTAHVGCTVDFTVNLHACYEDIRHIWMTVIEKQYLSVKRCRSVNRSELHFPPQLKCLEVGFFLSVFAVFYIVP